MLLTPIAVLPVIGFADYRLLSKESQSYVAKSSAFASQVLGAMDVASHINMKILQMITLVKSLKMDSDCQIG